MKAAVLRHVRFYSALGCGLIAFGIAAMLRHAYPLLVAGDVFYLVFLGLGLTMIAGQSAADLRLRAKSQDEGIAIVLLITLATMGYFCLAAFTALHERHGLAPLVMAGFGALLGWFVLHTVMAFHYADIHYFDDPDCVGDEKDLLFPGGNNPGPWDFLYYSFVVGMTAQVSDVQITTTVMRRATMMHGIVSFLFNTVLIAMAVNAAVAMAS
jgi:uncharacterized membrane protein